MKKNTVFIIYKTKKIMLTIKYKEQNNEVDNWKLNLETLVMAHEFIKDETIEKPILTNNKDRIIGENEISKYVDELMEFKNTWYCSTKR